MSDQRIDWGYSLGDWGYFFGEKLLVFTEVLRVQLLTTDGKKKKKNHVWFFI